MRSVTIMMSKNVGVRAAARILGVPIATLRGWADAGVGPLPSARGKYARDALSAWTDEMSVVTSTMTG